MVQYLYAGAGMYYILAGCGLLQMQVQVQVQVQVRVRIRIRIQNLLPAAFKTSFKTWKTDRNWLRYNKKDVLSIEYPVYRTHTVYLSH